MNGALLDSNKYELELFGEEKDNGSISYGALEKANEGTLLIDQVSEIPLVIQSKILRVLIDQKFKRLNGNNDINVDVRLICSSSKDLKDEIKIGNFREDLYHRLNVFEINIKSLNERISDIPLLIRYFSKMISANYNIKELTAISILACPVIIITGTSLFLDLIWDNSSIPSLSPLSNFTSKIATSGIFLSISFIA